jgi:hypothetical protein
MAVTQDLLFLLDLLLDFLLDQIGVNLCKAKMKKMEAKLLKAENQLVNCKVE